MADLKLVETMVRAMLKNDIGDANPSEEDIKNAINKVSLLIDVNDDGKEYVEKILQSSYKVRLDLGSGVVNGYIPSVACQP